MYNDRSNVDRNYPELERYSTMKFDNYSTIKSKKIMIIMKRRRKI